MFELLSDCGTSQLFVLCVHRFVIPYLHLSFAKGAAIIELVAKKRIPRKAASLAQTQVARVAPARPLQFQLLQVALHPISGACQKPR